MAVATDTLIADIKAALETQRDNTGTEKADQDKAIDDLAKAIGNAVEKFVKKGKVTVDPGITLMAASYAGATNATGTGSIDFS